jgi:tRNA modification GTPase
MKIIHRDCPIAVISTNSQASAALGVIRFSGFSSIELFSDSLSVENWLPRHAHFLKVRDDNGDILDEGIGLFFNAPNSFTGENVLELQLHGNPLSLKRILEFFCKKYNFEVALPGEFSYRAFKNEKLNLSQVEGLDLLLNANSGFGLSAANKMLNNELYESYLGLRGDYLELRSAVEISIDFSEDVGSDIVNKKIKDSLKKLGNSIEQLNRRCIGELSDLLTPNITLFGKTNAGKSTFFNEVLGTDRAIVSGTHGTTRDFVSEYLTLGGVPFKLVDTAGLRETVSEVEIEGIGRSLSLAGSSFFKILVINPIQDTADLGEDLIELADAVVFTHLDLAGDSSVSFPTSFAEDLQKFSMSGPMGAKEGGPIGPWGCLGPIGPVFTNGGPMGAKESGPIEPLLSLEELILQKYQSLTVSNPIPIQRHRDLILKIYIKFQELRDLLEIEADIAIISHEINSLGVELDELLGIVNSQEVLDHIFANFCIGK